MPEPVGIAPSWRNIVRSSRYNPMLDYLSVGDPVDVTCSTANRAGPGTVTPKLRRVIGPRPGRARRDPVTISQQIRERPLPVGHRSHDTFDRFLEALSSLLGLRLGLVVHDVFGDQICEVDRPIVAAVVETTNYVRDAL